MTRKSLGRGLGALIPDKDNKSLNIKNIARLNIEKIRPRQDQPRKFFDQESLDGLAESIKEFGLLNPIVVQKNNDFYEIIAGERRYRACILAGLKEIDAIIKEINKKDLDIISIIENIQREDLSALEEARAYNDLYEKYNMTQEEISKTVGKSRSYISNTMRLLKLDSKSKQELEKGNITSSQARTLLSIDDDNQRNKSLNDFINKKTNIRQVEKKSTKSRKKKIDKDKELDNILFEDFEEKFMDILGSKVDIAKNKDIYKVTIDCFSIDDIEKLYWRLNNENV